MLIVGGGQHARVVAEAALMLRDEVEVLGFVDPVECRAMTELTGIPWLGNDEVLRRYTGASGILGIGLAEGGIRRRQEAVQRLSPLLAGWTKVVHPAACVSSTASVGAGTALMAGAVVNTGARIGSHCVVNTGAVVEHDVVIGDHAFLGPRSVVGGGARIGDGAFVGLGACVRDHATVGTAAIVGMGAVLVSDAPPHATVIGVPARERSEGQE